MKKELLRKACFNRRSRLKNRAILDDSIAQNLFGWAEYINCKTIGLYSSIKDEVNTLAIFERARKENKRICFPRVGRDGGLAFFAVDSLKLLEKGAFGVYEPGEDLQNVESGGIDLLIIPALCYNRQGYRLGYGKGYYDRFLKGYNGITAGLVHNALVSDSWQAEAHDVAVSYLITETGVIKTGA